ncbi:hypothetical protein U9M48_004186 [Paspalum notatum var. saurae]|uniref:Uncharacterized protein n=1 Tax=Paspalum notatum var. saurae TaxID=547442 RepID=A0AAQ3SEM6_PASNO
MPPKPNPSLSTVHTVMTGAVAAASPHRRRGLPSPCPSWSRLPSPHRLECLPSPPRGAASPRPPWSRIPSLQSWPAAAASPRRGAVPLQPRPLGMEPSSRPLRSHRAELRPRRGGAASPRPPWSRLPWPRIARLSRAARGLSPPPLAAPSRRHGALPRQICASCRGNQGFSRNMQDNGAGE